jgi:hypothetical protein
MTRRDSATRLAQLVNPKLIAPKESAIQTAILKWLRVLGIPAIRVNSRTFDVRDATKRSGFRIMRANDVKGTSDILACLPPDGRFLALEVKRPGAKLSLEQSAFLQWIASAGGIGARVTSCQDVMELLDRHGWKR